MLKPVSETERRWGVKKVGPDDRREGRPPARRPKRPRTKADQQSLDERGRHITTSR